MNRYETMDRFRKGVLALALPALLAVTPASVVAQTAVQDIGGLRAYWHVFIAYSIAIVLLLGWVISIGRRLRDLEDRLGD